MEFEWDPIKQHANLQRHKLDFIDASHLFDGRPVITYPSPRAGERRFVTVGAIDAKFYAVVWTLRDQATRLIFQKG